MRGKFGEDNDDEHLPDTRWVHLSELVAYMDETELKPLDVYASKLQKHAQASRQRLRDSLE